MQNFVQYLYNSPKHFLEYKELGSIKRRISAREADATL
jgi:hypothetical protein